MLKRFTAHSAFRPSSLPRASIYISTSTSPYFNLSVEEWLFRKAPAETPLLLLYRNEPCVVIGRNQNPWKEVNFPALRALNVPFIRRRSGGGTVYHDLGNTNFSIHLPRASFNRHHTTKLIQRALVALGVDAEINERNDICVGGFKMSVAPSACRRAFDVFMVHVYVSGSAYKIVNTRAYHHGTMLISTELKKLGNILQNTKEGMVTKGVASVRSPVHNLQQFKSDVTHSAFVESVIAEFIKQYKTYSNVEIIVDDMRTREIDHIRDGIAELQVGEPLFEDAGGLTVMSPLFVILQTWEWQYGQTPEFIHSLSRVFEWGEVTANVTSKNGIILSCSISCSNRAKQEWCKYLSQALVGKRYAFLDELSSEGKHKGGGWEKQETIKWLREDM